MNYRWVRRGLQQSRPNLAHQLHVDLTELTRVWQESQDFAIKERMQYIAGSQSLACRKQRSRSAAGSRLWSAWRPPAWSCPTQQASSETKGAISFEIWKKIVQTKNTGDAWTLVAAFQLEKRATSLRELHRHRLCASSTKNGRQSLRGILRHSVADRLYGAFMRRFWNERRFLISSVWAD